MKPELSPLILISGLLLTGCASPPPESPPDAAADTPAQQTDSTKDRNDPFSQFDPSKAESDYRKDLAAGKLKLLSFGLPLEWSGEYASLLRSELGVDEVMVAGCIVTDNLVEYVKRYNRLSKREIESRFGPDRLEEIAEQARRNWKLRHPFQP